MQRSSKLIVGIIVSGIVIAGLIFALDFFYGSSESGDDVGRAVSETATQAAVATRRANFQLAPTVTAMIPVTPTPPADLGDSLSPNFGEICFDPAPTNGLPTGCFETAEGVVELHAFFDYNNLSETDIWLRVWSLNDQEALRIEEFWAGQTEGRFAYNLNTATGETLLPGDWDLALYINDQFQTQASFTIQAPVIVETPTPRPAPKRTDFQLAYTKWDGGKHSIWVAYIDGRNPRFLLDYAASPSWSADGQSIAFYGEEGIDTQPSIEAGTNGIWRMGANGGNPTQLVADGSARSVAWSPKGNLIAFGGARGGPDRRIYFVDLGGKAQPYELLGEQATWSPDGSQIISKVCRPQCGLWLSRPDNSAPQQLTEGGTDGLPAWSPDGRAVIFSRNVNGNVDLYSIRTDGSQLQQLTTAPGNDSVPAWTPDGRQIAFRSTRNGLWQIFVMNADGSEQYPIISDVGATNEWAFDRMSIRE